MAAPIIAEGGFNTGRMYSANGQEVYWWCDDDAVITFYDRSRMIIGVLHAHEYPQYITPKLIMFEYDAGNYNMACQPARIPEDFDFGPKLRI